MAYTNIDKPSDYFNTITWTGSDSNGSRSFTGVGFQPDLVWSKSRTATYEHLLYDSVRTAGNNKELRSNSTGAEGSYSNENYGYLSSFDSDGFSTTIGSDATYGNAYFNDETPQTYVAWNWLAGGTAVSNTDGSITSSVSANTTAGFSIVSYTGSPPVATVGHGLNAVPSFMILKERDAVSDWIVFHSSLANNQYLDLNNTNAVATDTNVWNNTAPTSSVFTVGDYSYTNPSSRAMIAYCFAEKKGFSKFGKYTGNGSTDGTFVYTGFKPAWLMIKNIDNASSSWIIHDNKRDTFNIAKKNLDAENSDSEATLDRLDILSNGFKNRSTLGFNNTSTNTYIYMAFAESPFTTSTGIPTTAR